MTRDQALAVKRLMDVSASALLSVVCLPVMAAVALAIKLDSPGPVLFTQPRAGMHGRAFRIYKFRTMTLGAVWAAPSLPPAHRQVTRVGGFLRRTSLDELPQLFNVLKGEMSLVGPRPQLLGTTRPDEWRRLEMRPGMTGLVEVSQPQHMTWDERMAMDMEYVQRWSLWLDLTILFRTIPVMFARKNPLDPPRDAEGSHA